jgi:hypothetical protein
MAATYRPLDDGGFLVDTPAGQLRTALSENALRSAGLVPYQGATAGVHGLSFATGDAPSAPAPAAADVPPPNPDAQGAISYQDWQRARIDDVVKPYLGFRKQQLNPAERLRLGQSAERMQSGPQLEVGPEVFARALKEGSGEMVTAESLRADREDARAVNEPVAGGKPGTLRDGSTVEDLDLAGEVANGRAAPPPARYIKTGGRDIRAGFQVQKSGIDDAEREALKEGLAENEVDQRLGMLGQAERDEAAARQRARDFDRNEFAATQEALKAQRERTQWINTEFAKKQQEIQRDRQAIEKLEISPTKVYEDEGAWLRIAAVVSMIAGGALQARRGGKNEGLAAVNDIIHDSMDAQRDNLAKRERGVQAKENALGQLASLYGSPEVAEAELRRRQLDYAQAYAKKFALETGSQEVMARVEQTFAERDRERLLENAKLDQELRDRVTESWQYLPEKVVQVGGGAQKPKSLDRMVVLQDGTRLWARTTTQANEVQGKVTTGENIISTLQKMKKLATDGTLTDLQKRAEYEALKQDIDADINVQKGQGAMGVEEAARMTNLTGDPSVVLNPQNVTRLDVAIRQQSGRRNALVRGYLHADPDGMAPALGGKPGSARSE